MSPEEKRLRELREEFLVYLVRSQDLFLGDNPRIGEDEALEVDAYRSLVLQITRCCYHADAHRLTLTINWLNPSH